MILARVVSHVVATQKDASHLGRKTLRVQPLDISDKNAGEAILALDSLDAGVGDKVVVTQDGWSAGKAIHRAGATVDAAVIGIVDTVQLCE